jgi:protein TonB
MKKTLLIALFILPMLVVHAQQPTPKNPKDPDSAIQINQPMKVVEISANAIFIKVEHEPEFPGGTEKLYQYLEKNLRYPSAAKENNIQGKVFVTFVVEKDGSLTGIKVKKSLSRETDAEAIRLIQASPKWNPGVLNGRAVRVQYTLPVVFALAD